jgi:hypothetical protein
MRKAAIILLACLMAVMASPDALYLYEETTNGTLGSLLVHMSGSAELSLIFNRETSVMELFNDIGLQKLVAIREKKETVQAGGRAEEAWRIRITVPDVRAFLWGAQYWFRATDGRLLRCEEVRGLPGTPPTVGVLKREWLE